MSTRVRPIETFRERYIEKQGNSWSSFDATFEASAGGSEYAVSGKAGPASVNFEFNDLADSCARFIPSE